MAPNGLEPLVVAWQANNRTILLPDQGFLMTYGLTPRTVRSDNGDVLVWDDLSIPDYDIVKVKMVSVYDHPSCTDASVHIRRDYLFDYASLRGCTLLQVYKVIRWAELTTDVAAVLAGSTGREIKLRGRTIFLNRTTTCKGEVLAEVRGVRHLFDPGRWPISKEKDDYGELTWPGISGPVTEERADDLMMGYVYVDDAVLGTFEERPEKYRILPETGGVYYENQWSVDRCSRVGRNHIMLELRKLYEGAPPHVVRHWHGHAVEPPSGEPEVLRETPNVATRSKRIVNALCDLGWAIAGIGNLVAANSLKEKDFVRWNDPNVTPITRHIPLEMREREFLERCVDLNKLVVEGLREKTLRKLLLDLGINEETIKELKCLKLLDILVQHCIIAKESGLRHFADSKEIEVRRQEKLEKLTAGGELDTPIDVLFVLYDLRIASAHRGKLKDELLVRLKTDRASLASGWGTLLDSLYDSLAVALEKTTGILRDSLP